MSDQPEIPSSPRRSPALQWAVANNSADLVYTEVEDLLRRRRRKRLAWAGSLAVFLAVSAVAVSRVSPKGSVSSTPVAVTIFAPEKKILSDGSRVELKPGAQ